MRSATGGRPRVRIEADITGRGGVNYEHSARRRSEDAAGRSGGVRERGGQGARRGRECAQHCLCLVHCSHAETPDQTLRPALIRCRPSPLSAKSRPSSPASVAVLASNILHASLGGLSLQTRSNSKTRARRFLPPKPLHFDAREVGRSLASEPPREGSMRKLWGISRKSTPDIFISVQGLGFLATFHRPTSTFC